MKQNTLLRVVVGLMIVLSCFNPVWASQSSQIQVSCSIPAIPGLNAPLDNQALEAATPQEENVKAPESTSQEAVTQMIQEIEERTQVASAESDYVRTVYSR